MSDLANRKSAARKAALLARKAAHEAANGRDLTALLDQVLRQHRATPLSGYLPIRTEIDPRPALIRAAQHGPVGVPVVTGPDRPLVFARWTPETPLSPGPFGARAPGHNDHIEPEIVIVPIVAFDAQGGRLGYGGGYYYRTLQQLRARRPTLAIGFAFDEQECAAVPREATDQPLDMLITPTRVLRFKTP